MFTIQFWVAPVQESSIFPKKCSKLGYILYVLPYNKLLIINYYNNNYYVLL